MTNPLSGRKTSNSKALPEQRSELQAAWESLDKQLEFDRLMNRLKRCVVPVEEIERLPKRWRDIALEQGYITYKNGHVEPRKNPFSDYVTPWEDQPQNLHRQQERDRIWELCQCST